MHVEIKKRNPSDRVLDLGGGGNRHPLADVCVDIRPEAGVDFQWDLTRFPWPIADADFDVAHAAYVLEHVPYAAAAAFLAETFRVLRSGGHAIFVLPNTKTQLEWIAANLNGWDGKGLHEAASELLYGSQNMPGPGETDANTHKGYFDQVVAYRLFNDVGFVNVEAHPYNERGTDMVVVARKPVGEYLGRPVVVKEIPGVPEETITLVDGRSVVEQMIQDAAVAQTPQERRHPAVSRPEAEGPRATPEVGAGAGEGQASAPTASTPPLQPPAQLFDKHYFNGGGKVGGYAREGYWDYPAHEVTARHILDRKPESVLELGCARGYVLKRIQDAGVRGAGLEVSNHCYLTRVAEGIHPFDLCKTKSILKPGTEGLWPFVSHVKSADGSIDQLHPFDLCFSVATLEHVPEAVLPDLISEMKRCCRRGLHGVDFGHNDDGFDKTHCTLKPRDWWLEQFARHAPDWPVEVVDKEFLESTRAFPEGDAAFWEGVRRGDGKLKLNIGSHTTMFHRGWTNVDVGDLAAFAGHYGYHYLRHDVRGGLPFNTGTVDLIYCGHMLEHLTYAEGLTFLRECRRVLKPDGAMRVIVPDAYSLIRSYCQSHPVDSCQDTPGFGAPFLSDFDEVNDGCAASPTAAGKLWSLLVPGHQAAYDAETLTHYLREAGFLPHVAAFRQTLVGSEFGNLQQILRETLDVLPCLSLYADAVPRLG